MTKEDFIAPLNRLQFYERALRDWKIKTMGNIAMSSGFCNYIHCVFFPEFIELQTFPELMETEPETKVPGWNENIEFWFPRGEAGRADRIKCLETAIELVKQKITIT